MFTDHFFFGSKESIIEIRKERHKATQYLYRFIMTVNPVSILTQLQSAICKETHGENEDMVVSHHSLDTQQSASRA